MAKAPTMLTSATVEPTDRSSPAVRIVKVCPNDTAASAAAATPMLRKFWTEKNTSEVAVNRPMSAATTSGSPTWRP